MTDTKIIGSCVIDGRDHIILATATDGTAKELTIRDRSGSLKNLKDAFPSSIMTEFWLTIGTPSDLDLVQFKDGDGAILFEWGGCIENALGQSPDLHVENVYLPITKGTAFEATTSD